MKSTKLVVSLFVVVAWLYIADACNEAVCAPKVSKCMLIRCCECNMVDKKNCSCCTDCQVCLAELYTECCSCVGLCPPPDPDMGLYKTSSIELLNDPIPDLFNVLTEMPDFQQRWVTYAFPRHQPEETLLKYAITIGDREKKASSKLEEDSADKNCSVAYFSQCMSIQKCKASCKSMGAAKYRWFHEYGCCQCVGDTCITYGMPEPHCLKCPASEDVEEAELEIDDADGSMKVEVNGAVKMAIDGV